MMQQIKNDENLIIFEEERHFLGLWFANPQQDDKIINYKSELRPPSLEQQWHGLDYGRGDRAAAGSNPRIADILAHGRGPRTAQGLSGETRGPGGGRGLATRTESGREDWGPSPYLTTHCSYFSYALPFF